MTTPLIAVTGTTGQVGSCPLSLRDLLAKS